MRLPVSLGIGDWVYFRCMGAYTLAAGSTFNGMPRPSTVHVCGEMAARRLAQGTVLYITSATQTQTHCIVCDEYL